MNKKLSERYLDILKPPFHIENVKIFGKICELEGCLMATPIYCTKKITQLCDSLDKFEIEFNLKQR